MRIQHNIMAMNAYRNYTNNVSAMQKNLEKLSSGYKINRAGDDAAGLAISEKMRAQITGLETAQKNAKDGISLVQTAEGALTEVHDMLNRMVTLATQSANGTYDNETDRAQLQKELDQLRSEINRIADSSNFNGIKLLDGSLDGSSTTEVEFSGTNAAMSLNIVNDGQIPLKDPTAGKYYIDFDKMKISNVSTNNLTVTFALGGFTLKTGNDVTFTLNGGESLDDGAAVANKILASLKDTSRGGSLSGINSNAEFSYQGVTFKVSTEGSKLVFEMTEPPKKDFSFTAAVNGKFDSAQLDGASFSGNAGNQFMLVPEREAVSEAGRVYAQATFDLQSVMGTIEDGSAIKIGDTTYTFAVGKDSEYKNVENVVDLTDMTSPATDFVKVAQRLATAAQDNKNFHVGTQMSTGNGVISLTEKEGGVDYNINNLAGPDGKTSLNGVSSGMDSTTTYLNGVNTTKANAPWNDLIQAGKTTIKENKAQGKALTLQIGDTAEDFNQLKVNIRDMHVSSLGIDSISIADQDSAAKAIDVIKSAINQVSDVRGTLGATQNRLDHTINNLSVMAENIQDAESTIRDTDVAEEMMAYTKNNILIQSAQAMLAQANQVPQGVLQLLQ